MTLLTRVTLAKLRRQYGPLWLLAIAEHWERHTSLEEIMAHVATLEEVWAR